MLKNLSKILLFCFLSTLSLQISSAQENNQSFAHESTLSLNQIRSSLDDVNAKREKVMQDLAVIEEPEYRESLEISLLQLEQQKRDFEKMFERLALGGLEIELYDIANTEEEEILQYDWQKELIKIVQPVFSSLQNLTESQRKRDFIRTTRAELQQNLMAIDEALLHLETIDQSQLNEASLMQLNKIQSSWALKRAYHANQLELINLQYREIEKEGSLSERILQGVWSFITNEGKILLLSLGAFFGILYFSSWILRRIVTRHEKKVKSQHQVKKVSLLWRILLLVYELFSFMLAFATLLVILHSSGDMVLFGLAILIILAMTISLRSSIPAYFKRLRTFLNMGLAREGERVIYQGIPWEIEHINLYSVFLFNPLLDNGRVRLTIDCIESMVSRDVPHSEAYYPTVAGDTVLIESTFAKIVRQTPETVYLDSYGTAFEYGTEEFAAKKPRNITTGYIASTQFVLDRSHRNDDIDAIIEILKATANEELAKDPTMFGLSKAVYANFREINAYGDLVFGMSILMGPNAEGFYFSTPRFLQRSGLIAAERFNWKLPNKGMIPIPS
ncbi:hypothetical protein [Ignatzschineria sp. LJL83]